MKCLVHADIHTIHGYLTGIWVIFFESLIDQLNMVIFYLGRNLNFFVNVFLNSRQNKPMGLKFMKAMNS